MLKKNISFDFNWYEFKSQDSDVFMMNVDVAVRILFDIYIIREFEEAVLRLKDEGCVHGPIHSCIGQEVNAAATIAALEKTDKVSGTHRSHHQFISKVMKYVLPDSWNPLHEDLPESGEKVIYRTLAEIMGLATGYCGGRGGSQHLRHAEAGFIGSNAIVGGGIPISTGTAFAEKYRKTGNIVVCFFSDGAINQGAFHEACNIAAVWRLPIIYFVENNLYAENTSVAEACAVNDLSLRAAAYGMDGFIVDGSDPVGVYEAMKLVAANVRSSDAPCIIESKCYRHYHHSGSLRGSACGYRSEEEEEEWLRKDACIQFPNTLIKAAKLKKENVKRLQELARRSVEKAVESCTSSGSVRKVRAELWPKPETVYEGMRSDGHEWKNVEFFETDRFDTFEYKSFSETIANVITHWIEKDDTVVFIGEEVANYGTILENVRDEVFNRCRHRIFNTPISEAGFIGLACGAAMSGMRLIVEIMYPDFSLVAADQLFNQIGKLRYMYGCTANMPIVVRTKTALGFGYGGQHSMNPMALFSLFPGWRIVFPSNAGDYIGLFNSAMQSLDPVLIVEHRTFYQKLFPVPKGKFDYYIPFGKAKIITTGDDVTVITYGLMTYRCHELRHHLTHLGISVEIIDLRSVDSSSIDYDTIGLSVRKTRKAVIIEETPTSQCIGRIISAKLTEQFFNLLKCPIKCVTSADVTAPVSKILESTAMIDDDKIVESIAKAVEQRKS